jgi:hypothetical protein
MQTEMNLDGVEDLSGWRRDEVQRRRDVERGLAVVANRSRDHNLIRWAKNRRIHAYIGRGAGGAPTLFGNPYAMRSEHERDAVCDAFAAYAATNDDITASLPLLRGKVLECFCHPKRCHGHTLAEMANR